MDDQNLDSAHDRLAWARENAGFAKKSDFAKAVGVDATTYRAYENGQNGYAKYAGTFARKLGVTAEWLLDGGQTPAKSTIATEQRSAHPPTKFAEDGTVEIQVLDFSFSMGPGTTVDDYVEEMPMHVDINFLRSITRTEFDCLKMGKGVGESMFPTLLGGDVVLVDTTQRNLNKQDGIYAISLFGAAAIKRLRMVGQGRVLIKSDNHNVGDQEVDLADLHIVGRVIWFGREL
ncbi:XRE family transcriptional regulator [Sphingobium sp. ba1]|jgi:phage repressor protein C with HTH and peptisase S24 domain|uniref:XRE family transcriptional regulator n=1 Tax=Sphingobium sp. ba1 TaxID=1522072 RepID=UPI00068CF632|nr:S24 family peptidase [Sphingobium sp. ba1]